MKLNQQNCIYLIICKDTPCLHNAREVIVIIIMFQKEIHTKDRLDIFFFVQNLNIIDLKEMCLQ